MARTIKYVRSSWVERLALAGLFFFSLFLVQLTMWKESEIFWMNVGGFPLWLRDSVKALYYPYLFFVLCLALMISRSVLGRFFREVKICKAWITLVVSWVVIFGSVGLLVANNLINIIEDRPLHYHPEDEVIIKKYFPNGVPN